MMSEIPDKPADGGKKVRRRTADGEGFTEAEDGKLVEAAADAAAAPVPVRTTEKTTRKAADSTPPASGGQAARMRFRRDRSRPRR